jgi:hypothetical protein
VDREHHVVLVFPQSEKAAKESLIAELKPALTDYSVFDSGGDKTGT